MSLRARLSPALAAAFLALSVAGVRGQDAKPFTPPPSTYAPPRTPWGDPDLMGVWDYQSLIRMERPAALAGKARFANEAEYRAWAKANAPNRETENAQGGVGAYNEWWNDWNFVFNLNTSLIVDPPTGRFPPLTPAAEHRRKEILEKVNELASLEDYHALMRCIASVTPNAPQAYNSGTYIMQSPGWVAIIRERLDTRLIPLDGRAHVGPNIRQIGRAHV